MMLTCRYSSGFRVGGNHINAPCKVFTEAGETGGFR